MFTTHVVRVHPLGDFYYVGNSYVMKKVLGHVKRG